MGDTHKTNQNNQWHLPPVTIFHQVKTEKGIKQEKLDGAWAKLEVLRAKNMEKSGGVLAGTRVEELTI